MPDVSLPIFIEFLLDDRHVGIQFEPNAFLFDASDAVEGWPIISRRSGRAKMDPSYLK